ncbi:pantoate--beta-alanine ligase [Candidatus Magnetoovum chiemensis]|nr:pantoate--beta-alanine ligase [Candidatus Magnetoovum chiemensis]
MQIISDPDKMQNTSNDYKMQSIGFVPTMGALHDGHLSLIAKSSKENDKTAVSIFVNPLQFGPKEDLNKYPRDINGDIKKLKTFPVDYLFMPNASSMYADDYATYVEVHGITNKLCGKFRSSHFNGVTTVVNKLFNIVKPNKAYFGQKDYQQFLVIKKMVKDLKMNIDIIMCPTVRKQDGLAMSSRNSYLNAQERKDAVIIYKSLKTVEYELQKRAIALNGVSAKLLELLSTSKYITEIQYASVYDPDTLDDISSSNINDYNSRLVLIAVAIKLGSTRLIDNILVQL